MQNSSCASRKRNQVVQGQRTSRSSD